MVVTVGQLGQLLFLILLSFLGMFVHSNFEDCLQS